MELTLVLNGMRRKAEGLFAQTGDFTFVKIWRECLGNDQNPIRNDSVLLAQLAVSRFEAEAESGVYANSLVDFRDHIASNPNVEVGGFILLKCDWFPSSEVIAFSHFRRSWSNKIILDYLGAHPFIPRPEEGSSHIVKGAGTALLYFISQVAKQENCTALWGEATSFSASYYQRVFKLDRVDDLIYVPKENLLGFAERCEKEWATADGAKSPTDQLLENIYTLEAENPPFLGSKTAVFNPSKRLAYRFLKLPSHIQFEIAKKLQFITNATTDLTREELVQAVFRGAREKNLISDLWVLVEKEYGDVVQEINPFSMSIKMRK